MHAAWVRVWCVCALSTVDPSCPNLFPAVFHASGPLTFIILSLSGTMS